jgi:multicomponent Na+:H+ antiporter subunit D
MLVGAFEAERLVAVAVIIVSTLLNAAYFLPIIYAAFFKAPRDSGNDDGSHHDPDHGEAPLPMVIALTVTAAGAVLLFFLPQLPLDLARQLVEVKP